MTGGIAHINKKEFTPLVEAVLESDDPKGTFDDYREKNWHIDKQHQVNSLREVLVEAVAECLNHDEFAISANAAVILREHMLLCSRVCDLDALVAALTDQVNERRIQPAKEAATTLAFFLSTRPTDRDLPRWDGSDPMASTSMLEDLDQHRLIRDVPIDSGYLHRISPATVESATDALISNLNRKEYKRSSEWAVARECAKALGAIGYQRPELVSEAVPAIEKLLGKPDERQGWLVYALTSIGYTRPDLVPDDLASRLKEYSENGSLGPDWRLYYAAQVGHRKIGHAPIYLQEEGCDTDSDLKPVVEKLFNFMLNRFPSGPEEYIQAFVEIYRCRPDDLVSILSDELDLILQGNPRAYEFPDNFMRLLSELADVDVADLKPILDRSDEIYRDHAKSHYWYENALELHRRIAVQDEDLLPANLGDTVTEFVESEGRASVKTGVCRFLEEIGQLDDDLEAELQGPSIIGSIEELVDSEEFEVESLVEEIDPKEAESDG